MKLYRMFHSISFFFLNPKSLRYVSGFYVSCRYFMINLSAEPSISGNFSHHLYPSCPVTIITEAIFSINYWNTNISFSSKKKIKN